MSSQVYLNSGSSSDDLQELQNHDTIKYFASMPDDYYNLVKATNPTLRLFVDLAKRIMAGGGME